MFVFEPTLVGLGMVAQIVTLMQLNDYLNGLRALIDQLILTYNSDGSTACVF